MARDWGPTADCGMDQRRSAIDTSRTFVGQSGSQEEWYLGSRRGEVDGQRDNQAAGDGGFGGGERGRPEGDLPRKAYSQERTEAVSADCQHEKAEPCVASQVIQIRRVGDGARASQAGLLHGHMGPQRGIPSRSPQSRGAALDGHQMETEVLRLSSAAVRVLPVAVGIYQSHEGGPGILVVGYIDDFILVAPTKELALLQRDTVIMPTLAMLGLVREPSKGSWDPTTRAEILGLILDSVKCTVEVPEKKVREVQELAGRLVVAPRVSARFLAGVAGKVVSVARAFPLARVVTRSFYQLIDAAHRAPWQWDSKVEVSDLVRADAQWILENMQLFCAKPAWKPSRLTVVCTDASMSGWGAALGAQLHVAGKWSEAEQQFHINTLELLAIKLAVWEFRGLLKGRNVLFRTDSLTAKACLERGGSDDQERQLLVREIWSLSIMVDFMFSVEWIPGSSNQVADALSRDLPLDDWALKRAVFWEIQRLPGWGHLSVDRFADGRNHQLPRFNAREWCQGVEAVDAFTQDWKGERNWLCLSFGLIQRALRHLQECGAVAVIVVPEWPGQPWWPLLCQLAVEWFPLASQDFVPGRSGVVEPWKNPAWRFWAVRVTGS